MNTATAAPRTRTDLAADLAVDIVAELTAAGLDADVAVMTAPLVGLKITVGAEVVATVTAQGGVALVGAVGRFGLRISPEFVARRIALRFPVAA